MSKPTTAKTADVLTDLVRGRIGNAEITAVHDDRTDEERVTIRVAFEQSVVLGPETVADPEALGAAILEAAARVEQEYAGAFAPYLAEREQRLAAAIEQFQAERDQYVAELTRQRKIVDRLVGVES